MESKTAKLVNEQRVIELLDCYGADADNWPQEERSSASALIKNSLDLQKRQHEARQLDELMGVTDCRKSLDARPDAAAVARIVSALPEQPMDNTVNLHGYRQQQAREQSPTHRAGKRWNAKWTYSAAAAVFLAIGVILQQPSQPLQPSQTIRTAAVSQEELDLWMWQEATGLSDAVLSEQSQEDGDMPITFMAMMELDMQPSDE